MLSNSQHAHQSQLPADVYLLMRSLLDEVTQLRSEVARLQGLPKKLNNLDKRQRYLEYDMHAKMSEHEEVNSYLNTHSCFSYEDQD